MKKQEMSRLEGRVNILSQLIEEHQGELMLVLRNYRDSTRNVFPTSDNLHQDYTKASLGLISGPLNERHSGIIVTLKGKLDIDVSPEYDVSEPTENEEEFIKNEELLLAYGTSIHLGNGNSFLTGKYFQGIDFRIGREDIRAYFEDIGLLSEYKVLEKIF